ncbi:DUF6197 family protein [Streptomyces malaysiensis]|uniref:Uncharacterized protein n=1 Tax=Streptomyces malaysiensis subsp. samsunensis TaxID=459658 RepID=A0A9X2LY60_STRMQ|nr:hypothetical protein [Streptomyces samsunensis]MCQ8831802.1 hypothetical protein [Streptomyces samsunensis]
MTTVVSAVAVKPALERAEVLEAAGELLAEEARFSTSPTRFWFGLSGTLFTGEEVAQVLDAARERLETEGWRRDRAQTSYEWVGEEKEAPEEPDESASTGSLLRYLVRLVSWAVKDSGQELVAKTEPGLTLGQALGDMDRDSRRKALDCMELVLCAQSGTSYACADAWAERHGRTFDEVRGLLMVTAEFARRYGPEVA